MNSADGASTQKENVWTWWSALGLATAYVLLPGALRSPFSGIPLASKATLLFACLLLLALLTALYRPLRRPGVIWSIALLVLIAAKLLLVQPLVHAGWKGVYHTRVLTYGQDYAPFTIGWFQNRGPAAEPYRIDRRVDFRDETFGLSFINEVPYPFVELEKEKRQLVQPLVVQWTAYTHAERSRPLRMKLTATGRMTVDVDGKRILDVTNPENVPVKAELTPGTHRVRVIYVKRVRQALLARIVTDKPLTVTPATTAQIRASLMASRAIDALGFVSLLLLLAAFLDAYRPLRRLLLVELWSHPDRLAAFALATLFVMNGVLSIRDRHSTLEIPRGHDPIAYENLSRQIARNGLLMVDDNAEGEAYFFYPLYSYGLAAAHIVFGDDFSNVSLFNELCGAASILLMWVLLRNWLRRGRLALLLLLIIAPFILANYGPYARDAFSDNLFAPVVLLMLVASVAAFRGRSMGWLFVAGALTALGAAARASLMTHIAFLGLAVLLYRDFGSFWRRICGGAVVTAGFIVGIAFFTIRNWIVAKQLILLVSSVGQMPYFMNIAPDGSVPVPLLIDGRLPTIVESLGQMVAIFKYDPPAFIWHEIRKALFTLGFINEAGPPGMHGPNYFMLIPPLFLLALWLRRIPKPTAVALGAFCASHMMSMVMAAPWTYGYKTVLPFMLVCIAGGAFLLRGAPKPAPAVRARMRQDPATLSVIIAGTGAYARVAAVERLGIAAQVIVGADDEPYGAAVKRGLAEATSDIIAVLPADSGYPAEDVRKLVVFARDYDAVFGTRQSETPVPYLALHWMLAKAAGLLYGRPGISGDAGCGVWMIHREASALLLPSLRATGTEITLEVLMTALRAGLRVTHVPVNYVAPEGTRVKSGAGLMPLLRVLARNARLDAST